MAFTATSYCITGPPHLTICTFFFALAQLFGHPQDLWRVEVIRSSRF
jgi:hypothetical protein